MSLEKEVEEIVKEFEVSDALLNEIVDYFALQGSQCLNETSNRGMPMIPTYVTRVPTGKEKGTFLSADLGGTNFRVCSVLLHGDNTYDIKQEKWPVPESVQVGSSEEFLNFLAERIKDFLSIHHAEVFERDTHSEVFRLGFTFSFPVAQENLDCGYLLRWTKGFNIPELVGKDIVAELQKAIDRLNLHVRVAALVNDTVGALLARAYTMSGDAQTMVGMILGTGTNAAYTEKISNIGKFDAASHPELKGAKIMVVNTEWGSFDNDLHVLPNTRFDKIVDKESQNPTFHMFEKRVSGLFLGEILRLALRELHDEGLIFSNHPVVKNLDSPFSTDTSIPSMVELDKTPDLDNTAQLLLSHFGVETSQEEREAVLKLSRAISRRSAYLVAGAISGLMKLTKGLEKFNEVDIGGDGSIIEYYPNFELTCREALKKTFVGEDEKRIHIGIAKDGSGVGAALCAVLSVEQS